MFSFIHTYIPDTPFWDGLVKRGFIDNSSGLKLSYCSRVNPAHMFNEIAVPGGIVDRIVAESDRLFYIDRIQGGSRLYFYDNDPALVRYYGDRYGERFLGFQIHETVSNFISDYHKLLGDYGTYKGLTPEVLAARPTTAEGIAANILKTFPDPAGRLYIESQTVEQWLETPDLNDPAALLESVKKLFLRRMTAADGTPQPLMIADSCVMATRLEKELGLTCHMPEIGQQTPMVRVQLALVRGMMRGAGLPFGAYQEPWGGIPFSCCYFKRDGHTEWGKNDGEASTYNPAGEFGGSSLSLLRRVFYYAWLAGASWLSEEWGACNTFYDWQDFEITPYGQIKKDFIDFTHAHEELGNLYTPIAIVLPKELKMLNINAIAHDTNYFRFYEDLPYMADHAREWHIYEAIRRIYMDPDMTHAGEDTEWRSLTNNPLGDLFDIVYEDTPGIGDRYRYFVDLTGKNTLHFSPERIIDGADIDRMQADLLKLQDTLVPFRVEGKVHWLMDTVDGGYAVTFINNKGVLRSVANGERKDPAYGQDITVTLDDAVAGVDVLLADTPLHRDGSRLTFRLEAGEMMILRLGIK